MVNDKKRPHSCTSFCWTFKGDEKARVLPLSCQHSHYYVFCPTSASLLQQQLRIKCLFFSRHGIDIWVGAIVLGRNTETCLGNFQVGRIALQQQLKISLLSDIPSYPWLDKHTAHWNEISFYFWFLNWKINLAVLEMLKYLLNYLPESVSE